MHRDSTDVVTHQLDFTGMNTRADVEAQLFDLGSDSRCAADRPGWAVEACHDPVTGGVCFAASIMSELRPDESVVTFEFFLPNPVTEFGRKNSKVTTDSSGLSSDIIEAAKQTPPVTGSWQASTAQPGRSAAHLLSLPRSNNWASTSARVFIPVKSS